MTDLRDGVGLRAANAPDDVRAVKSLLNFQATRLRLARLSDDTSFDAATDAAIRAYQLAVMGMRPPSGLIEPGSATLASLDAQAIVARAAFEADERKRRARLSGLDWFKANQAKYPNSNSLSTLAPAFGAHVKEFLGALRSAGADVRVSVTRRSEERDFVMYWASMVAAGNVAANKVPKNAKIDIEWDHGNPKASREAAKAMVKAFAIVHPPSLKSRHLAGLAIDMTITWTRPISVEHHSGELWLIDTPREGATNPDLHKIGKSYGVIKLLKDRPHWSSDGH